MIYKHKNYPHAIRVDKRHNGVVSGYLLDSKGKRIPNGRDVHFNKAYKRIVTSIHNLIATT